MATRKVGRDGRGPCSPLEKKMKKIREFLLWLEMKLTAARIERDLAREEKARKRAEAQGLIYFENPH